MINSKASAFTCKIINSLRERGIDLKSTHAIFVGGGSVLLEKYILSSKGRNTARYIADAVLAYESSLTDRIETAVTKALNNVLHQGSLKLENRNETEDFEFDEIADVLDDFRK